MSSANNHNMMTSSLFPWSTLSLASNIYGRNLNAIFPFTHYPIYPFGNMGWSNIVQKDYLMEVPSFNSLLLPTKSDEEFKNKQFPYVQSNEFGQCPVCEFSSTSRTELNEHFLHEMRKIEDCFQNFKSKSNNASSASSSSLSPKIEDQSNYYGYENRRNVLNNIKSRRLQRVHAKRLSSSPYQSTTNYKCDQISGIYLMQESKSAAQSPISDAEKETFGTKKVKKCNNCKKVCKASFVSLICRHVLCFNCYSTNKLQLNEICPICKCDKEENRFDEIVLNVQKV